MKNIYKTIDVENLANALLSLIQAQPPEDFNVQGFKLLVSSGRIQDATKMIHTYLTERSRL